ncbi:MAG: tRNA 2-thiouridine(34) synthase MnmA [Planctomycetia bacterium]|nr:tRNA 2-thiouridine(34) synthase MnmA [Planctomycetia bacterium]
MSAKRVVVAMSGGVDSSVAALLLKEQGYDVVGIFLRTGVAETQRADQRHRGCCSALDARDALGVADRLGIPCYSMDFADDFRQVMSYFADEYVRGRTPNPCVVCNSEIKFGKLWQVAQSLDAEFLATGHYCRVDAVDGVPTLKRAVDEKKDQTYVLFGIEGKLLPRLKFPIGGLTKAQVREKAREAGLLVADKPESQDICFVPDGDAAGFVQKARPEAVAEGDMVDVQGNVLGHHTGVAQFTVGQRKGLGLDRSTLKGQKRFVLELIPEEAKVVIGTETEGQVIALQVEQCNWFLPVKEKEHCLIKWSHRGELQDGYVDSVQGNSAVIRFDKPQFGVAPGQAMVIYRESAVVGGGWIKSTQRLSKS